VHIIDPASLDDLIADAATFPAPNHPTDQAFSPAAPWQVDDDCYAQVRELDEYV
jgi:hypothetical protein